MKTFVPCMLWALVRLGVLGTFGVLVTSSANAKVEGDTIILGSIISLTGKFYRMGIHVKHGYDLTVEKINRSGGIKVGDKSYKMKVIYYDDKSTPARGARLAKRLIRAG